MIFPVLLVLCAIGCAFKAFISYNGDISREASVFQSPLQLSPARIVSVDLTDDIPTSGRTLNVLSIVPQDWSESTIAQQLMQMRTEPTPIVSHYISSLKQRFIIGQDDRTALVRIKFMRRQLDAMKLFKEMKGVYDDFDVMELEKEKKIKMLKLETQALDRKANTQGSLEELQARRDEMQLQLEMA